MGLRDEMKEFEEGRYVKCSFDGEGYTTQINHMSGEETIGAITSLMLSLADAMKVDTKEVVKKVIVRTAMIEVETEKGDEDE